MTFSLNLLSFLKPVDVINNWYMFAETSFDITYVASKYQFLKKFTILHFIHEKNRSWIFRENLNCFFFTKNWNFNRACRPVIFIFGTKEFETFNRFASFGKVVVFFSDKKSAKYSATVLSDWPPDFGPIFGEKNCPREARVRERFIWLGHFLWKVRLVSSAIGVEMTSTREKTHR